MKTSKAYIEGIILNIWGHNIKVREYEDKTGRLRTYIEVINDKTYDTHHQIEARNALEILMEAELNERETSEEKGKE